MADQVTHDPDAYDRQRDDRIELAEDEPSPVELYWSRRYQLDSMCGVSDAWYDLDSEGMCA